jgi:hypothetical protein
VAAACLPLSPAGRFVGGDLGRRVADGLRPRGGGDPGLVDYGGLLVDDPAISRSASFPHGSLLQYLNSHKFTALLVHYAVLP